MIIQQLSTDLEKRTKCLKSPDDARTDPKMQSSGFQFTKQEVGHGRASKTFGVDFPLVETMVSMIKL